MSEWKRFFKLLLVSSITFFIMIDMIMYKSLVTKNDKIITYEKSMVSLNKIKNDNEKLREDYKEENKKLDDVTSEIEKIEQNIDELKKEENSLREEIAKKAANAQNGLKTVYLTFDDGPSARTEEILNILDKYHVKATFFVTMQNEKYDYLIKRMFDEGHTVGLHTASHNYREIYASEDAYFNDLKQIQDKVYNLTGYRSVIIRFPGGSSNTVSRFNPGIMTRLTSLVTERGYYYHDWNVDSGDAAGALEERQMNNIRTYSPKFNTITLLMHDSSNKYATVNSLEEKIKYYLDNGYSILPLTPSSPCVHHGLNN